MQRKLIVSNLLAVVFLTLTFNSIASAVILPARTFVGSSGLDSNPCSRNSPCATFAGAVGKTASGGEINCVDTADYGTVSIGQAITIDCAGTRASILIPSGQTGITVVAGTSDVVTIRNLSINGTGVGNNGIDSQTTKALHLENVTISGLSSACVSIMVSTTSQVSIDNATLSDCQFGVVLLANGTTLVANINNSRIYNTTIAVGADNGSRVSIRDSNLSSNKYGVQQTAFTGMNGNGSVVTVVNSTLAYSSNAALQSRSGEFMLAFGNTFINNVLVFNPNGGQIYTGSDNNNSGSGTVGTTASTVPKI